MVALRRSVEREGVIKFLTVRNWVLVLRAGAARRCPRSRRSGRNVRIAPLNAARTARRTVPTREGEMQKAEPSKCGMREPEHGSGKPKLIHSEIGTDQLRNAKRGMRYAEC